MGILSQAVAYLASLGMQVVSFLGYFGIFILMACESMILPMPAELVMPFAGFLAATGKMNFILIIVFSSLGSICGSLISYYIGKIGGIAFVRKFGRYLLLDEDDLLKTKKWFRKSGDKTIFFSRFIPVVRHIISIPAGIGKMDLKKFCIYTIAGATIWNTILAYFGYLLGKNWLLVRQYTEPVSVAVTVAILAVACWFVYRHIQHKKQNK